MTSAWVIAAILASTSDVQSVAVAEGEIVAATTGGLLLVSEAETTVLTTREGLPDNSVRTVFVEGNAIWVGTDRGAVRIVDGEVGETRARGQRVFAIARHDGDLFLGTTGGLFRGTRLVSDVAHVRALASTQDGLYVATAGSFLHLWDGTRLRRLRSDRFTWDLAAFGSDVYVATSRGIRRYRAGRMVPDRAARRSRSLPVADVRALAVVDDTVVAGTWGGGLFRYRRGQWREVEGSPRRVQALSANAAVLGTPEGWYELAEGRLTRRSSPTLPSNDIAALAETSEGLWVGTFRHGLVLRRRDGSLEIFDEERGLVDGRINRLVAQGDRLWVATDRGVMERRNGEFVFRGLLGRHVFALGTAHGLIWAGAGADLYVYRDGAFARIEQPGSRPQAIVDREGSAVVATAEGLVTRHPDGWRVRTTEEGLTDDWVTAAAVHGGETFVGTYNAGVSRVGREVETLRDDLWVNAGAMLASDRGLAVGTLDQGFWHYDGGWQSLTTDDGLPDNDVTAILKSGEGYWLATRGGIVRIEPAEHGQHP
ncbi:MAG: two-component regulator propeller domain-containing protein [Myxococcota bacterium]